MAPCRTFAWVALLTVLPVVADGRGLPSQTPSYFDSGVASYSPPAYSIYFYSSPVVGDFDGDGWPDVAELAGWTPRVDVFRGSPTGLLPPLASFVPGVFVNARLRRVDFDADGKLDLLLRASGADPTLSILNGAGDGTFPVPPIPVVTQLGPFEVGDLNGDAFPDVVVAGSTFTTVRFGNGAGMGQGLILAGPQAPHAVAIADFDGDGLNDILVTTYLTTLFAFRSVAPGQFAPGVLINVGNTTWPFWGATPWLVTDDSIVSGDLNNDGRADLVYFAGVSGGWSLRVMLGSQTSILQASTEVALLPAGLSQLRILDVDGDGNRDILWQTWPTPGYVTAASIWVSFGNGTGGFGPATSLLYGYSLFYPALAPADLDRDGDTDLVYASLQGGVTDHGGQLPTGLGIIRNRALSRSGAAGTNGVPGLFAGSAVRGNASFALSVFGVAPSTPCALALATSATSAAAASPLALDPLSLIPLPGSVSGIPIVLAAPWGVATLNVPIPNLPQLQNAIVYAQGAALDPQGSFVISDSAWALTRLRTIIIR